MLYLLLASSPFARWCLLRMSTPLGRLIYTLPLLTVLASRALWWYGVSRLSRRS